MSILIKKQSHIVRDKEREEKIIYTVLRYLNVSRKRLMSKRRTDDLVFARKLIAYFLMKDLSYGPSLVGRVLDRNHSTLVHHAHDNNDQLEVSKHFRRHVETVQNLLLTSEEISIHAFEHPLYQRSVTQNIGFYYTNFA